MFNKLYLATGFLGASIALGFTVFTFSLLNFPVYAGIAVGGFEAALTGVLIENMRGEV